MKRPGEGCAPGTVYFVGAGPGDPELITVKGLNLIRAADVIIYTDSLLPPDICREARPGARVYASSGRTLEEIVALMAEAAGRGEVVVRLHTGDPSLYGALHEQVAALERLRIPYEVVPGVTSATAAAAALGAELTVPGVSQAVIIARAPGRTPVPEGQEPGRLAAHAATMVLFLSAAHLEQVAADLIAGGYPPDTPAAVAYRVSWPDQRLIRGTLADIAERARAAGISSHALIMVGRVFDPALRADETRRSRLYDPGFGHGRRLPAGGAQGAGGDAQGAGGGQAVGGYAQAAGGAGRGAAGVRPPRVAIAAITRHGARLGARLQRALAGSTLFAAERFAAEASAEGAAVTPFGGPLRALLAEQFRRFDGWVLFVSLGAVVRIIAPLLGDKRTDPGVVVVDEQGRHAVAVLSGHLGGANELARRVAAALGARPVITTASDAAGTIAVDLLGRQFGWVIEDDRHVTAASAAVVNGDPVAVFQDAGERDWWPRGRPLPPNIAVCSSLDEVAASGCAAALIITDRVIPERTLDGVLERAVVYRPKSLVVGLGCNRGTAEEEIAAAVADVLAGHGLSPLSVRSLATVEAKRDEPGLLAYAARSGLPLAFYPAKALDAVAVPNPSAAVRRHVGTRGVAEPAALLAAGADRLVVEKQKRGNVTVAVARIPLEEE